MGYSPMVKIPTLAFWQETVFEAASSTDKKEERHHKGVFLLFYKGYEKDILGMVLLGFELSH